MNISQLQSQFQTIPTFEMELVGFDERIFAQFVYFPYCINARVDFRNESKRGCEHVPKKIRNSNKIIIISLYENHGACNKYNDTNEFSQRVSC